MALLLWTLTSAAGLGSRASAQALQDTAVVGLSRVQAWSSVDANVTVQVAWGDVDGDGDLDLAAAGYPSIRVYANEGGVLRPSAIWTSAGTDDTTSIAWGDVDGDGDLDLAVGNQFGPNKLYENVDGVLQSSAAWSSDDNYDSVPSLAWGDIDGDGDLDLALGTRRVNDGGLNKVYVNEGGVLQKSATWFSDDRDDTASIAWGDVDNDGDLDLAVGNIGGPNKLYLNEGGMLQASAVWSSDDRHGTPNIAWLDMDGDGDLDLAADGDSIKVYVNDGGVLKASATWSPDDRNGTYHIAWGDVDGDGDLDLAGGDRYGRTTVYVNVDGVLETSAAWSSDDSYNIESIAWGDVDGDGDLDLAVGNFAGPDKLYINKGSILQTTASWSSDNSDAIRSMAWGDVDGDGDLDLAVGSDYGGPDKHVGAQVYLNEGGALQADSVWSSNDEYDDPVFSLAWGDVDGDGDLDLATVGYLIKLYANVDGMLLPRATWSSDNIGFTTSLAWGDVDGDGDLDIAVGGEGPRKLYANENGVLQTDPIWTSDDEYATTYIAWGDVDGDGDLDLAVSKGWRAGASVYINADGELPSTPTWSSAEKGDTSSVAWGDMDGDGDLDLAVGGRFGFSNLVYLTENGMLQASAAWSSADSYETTSLAWGDIDGDGDLDLAAANWEQRSDDNAGGPNRLYLNEDGMLQATAVWSSVDGGYADSLAWGDVDGDGDLDLAVGGSSLKIYANGRPSHPRFAGQSEAVSIALNSSPISSDLQTATALAPANFYAVAGIRTSATIPISYTIDYPDNQLLGSVRVFYSPTGGGDWRPAVGENTVAYGPSKPQAHGDGAVDLARAEQPAAAGLDAAHRLYFPLMSTPHARGKIQGVFDWDLFASGVFGQSDNMVVRIEVLPYLGPVRNGIPGPFQRPFVSAQTYPFRVRGTQVRVLDEAGAPVAGAHVYRLPAGQTADAMPIAAAGGTHFVTNSQGYLQGNGMLAEGDGLVALVPITATHAFTLYHMSAAPTATGLDLFTVQEPGVQELRVVESNPLALFSLDISLEWDARNDATFLSDLEAAIQGASDILFDITNGQAALGDVRVHQAKEHWADSHVVLYATNSIHPRASIGGVVATPTDDQGTDGPIPGAYLPGQVRLGPLWDPFGESQVELSEDWQRALAHELAHYLLFLPDNYLGFDGGLLALVDCQGSFMTNAYDDDYSELLTRDHWDQQETCRRTVAQRLTGRADWETVTRFLPWLQAPATWTEVNPGPTMLPLAVPQISFVEPAGEPDATLPAQNFDLRHGQTGELTTVRQAQAYLFKSGGTGDFETDITDDQVIALGSTGRGADRIKVRGAAVDDRLCVLAPQAGLLGCTVLTETTRSVTLEPAPGWQPDIVVTPVNSTTLDITVTQAISGAELYVQVLPAYGSPEAAGPVIAPWAAMSPVGPDTFSRRMVLESPAFEGAVRVWVPGSRPHREAVTQFFLSAGWGPNARGSADNRNVWGPNARGSANTRAWGANYRTMEAPIASGDGRVTIFNLENLVGDNGGTALQALSTLPGLPLWLTPVGLGYRFVAAETFTRTIAFHYLQREVPEGYEQTLTLYYSPDEGRTWQRLATDLDVEENLASAFMPRNAQAGQGIYALQAAVEMPPLTLGWNLFNYPIPQARPVATALASITGAYTSVYRYDAGQERPWRLYDAAVADEHPDLAPLVNELDEMVLGPSYWLFATEVITPVLAVPDSNATAATGDQAADVLGLPPATFYGPVLQVDGFDPLPGMTVTARIGAVTCGQATLQEWQGAIVYVLQVASRKEVEGCGTEGAPVLLEVDGRSLGTRPWSNHQANYVPLPDN